MSRHKFRAWLFGKLRDTRYATIELRDEEIDGVAKRLGVDPVLLLEVRAQVRVDLHSRGFAPSISNAKRKLFGLQERIYQSKIWMPTVVFAAWNAECARRGVHPPTFLRSLIHSYLLGDREPEIAPHWMWRGELLREVATLATRERAVITHGAARALKRRAAARHTSMTGIMRGLVLEALAGQHMGIPLLSTAMMYDDENRYNLEVLDPHLPPR